MTPHVTIKTPSTYTRLRVVEVDGEPVRTTSKAVLRELSLTDGEIPDVSVLVRQIDDCEPTIAMQRALTLLSYRERTRPEVLQSLADDGYPENLARAVCDRLEESGLLDEDRFVEVYIRTKHSAGWGSRRIRQGLNRAGVDPGRVDLALTDAGEADYERALRYAQRRSPRCQRDIQKVAAALSRRGFDPEIAWRAAREASVDSPDDLDASTC
ncbi:MAG: regulatory protein RecX [Actinomycetota bacterium]|nr:regulatory protein RecX [Actinomycetota bacterium]MDZ4180917.1 regulatory protein RecX [Coriobacteriia bacterium]